MHTNIIIRQLHITIGYYYLPYHFYSLRCTIIDYVIVHFQKQIRFQNILLSDEIGYIEHHSQIVSTLCSVCIFKILDPHHFSLERICISMAGGQGCAMASTGILWALSQNVGSGHSFNCIEFTIGSYLFILLTKFIQIPLYFYQRGNISLSYPCHHCIICSF